ncbi:MAG: DUF87 domain-containing protein [Candidatus Bathyarchaeia archaeon]
MKFKLSDDFVIDSDEKPWSVEGLRLCIFGGAGSGKSWTAALIAEQFLSQGGTVVIFEPRAEYHTLKELKGDLVVLGGAYSKDLDFIPAYPSTYAKAIVERGISMVFYTSDVEDEEKLIGFSSKLIHYILKYQEEHKRPLLIILEEAQEYIPRSPSGHVAPSWVYSRMIKAFKDCFLQGRKLNVAMIAVSPRPQEINFSARQLANLTLYGKFGAQDLSYIDKECLKWYRERGLNISAKDLMNLDTGEFLVIGGAEARIIHVTEPRKTTHGAITPELKAVAPRKAETKVAINELAESIRKALEKEALEESEIQKAKKRIMELEDELRKSSERIKILESQVEMLSKIKVETPTPIDTSLVSAISEIHSICERILNQIPPPATAETKNKEDSTYQLWEKKLPPSASKILKLLVETKGRKYTKSEIAVATGYSSSSGTFNHALSILKRHQLVKTDGKHFWVN